MNKSKLVEQIQSKKSFLTVGLDTDLSRIPKHLLDLEDPIFEFNKAIIDATKDYCVGYKPNIAFYESYGLQGWNALQKTLKYIPDTHFTIADAKRGDIGNTSRMYAKAFFDSMNFDSITVAPYMGEDSVTPFLEFEGKWVILLALTSNNGAGNFQFLESNGKALFENVLTKAQEWGTTENLMFVVGATKAEHFIDVRKIVPNHFLLVPGIGAQGGSLESVCKNGLIEDYGLLINSSRSIIYADEGAHFAEAAGEAALNLQRQMAVFI